jgi:hypothetical protein
MRFKIFCKHDFVFVKTVEVHIDYGCRHAKAHNTYVCKKCLKRVKVKL